MAAREAEELKSEGNGLFKQEKFAAASRLYAKALKRSPQNAYLWNLSAALFEQGAYAECVAKCEQLLAASDVSQELIEKVNLRKLKALQYGMRLEEAVTAAGALLKKDDSNTIANEIKASSERIMLAQASIEERLLSVPRYRPAYEDVREYYTMGHDDVTSILGAQPSEKPAALEVAFKFSIPSAKDIPLYEFSALFVGIGDARNLFASLADLGDKIKAAQSKAKSLPLSRIKIHFTLNDVVPATLARDLIFFTAMRELATFAQQEAKTSKRAVELKMIVFYTYWCRIMPPRVEMLLQKMISRLIKALDIPSDQSYSNDWIFIQAKTVPPIRTALQWWQDNPQPIDFDEIQEGASDTKAMRSNEQQSSSPAFAAMNAQRQSQEAEKRAFLLERLRTHHCEAVDEMAEQEGVSMDEARELIADREMRQQNIPQPLVWENYLFPNYQIPPKEVGEPEELDYMWSVFRNLKFKQDPKRGKVAHPEDLYDKYIQPRWKTNCTLASKEWTPQHDLIFPYEDFHHLLPEDDPLQARIQQHNKSDMRVTSFDYFNVFFDAAVDGVRRALKLGQGSLMLEIEAGEGMALMQNIAWGSIKRQEGFPTRYNRVHLSNVPDYVGGYLSSFTIGGTLLKTIPNAYLTQCNLLNSPVWEGFNSLDWAKCRDSELYHYTAATCSELPKLYGVRLTTHPNHPGFYHAFGRVPSTAQQLALRTKVTEIVYDVFSRLVIPHRPQQYSMGDQLPMETRDSENVHSLFRLLEHLKLVGFPSHFLSQLCLNILANKIYTAPLHVGSAPAPLKTREQARKPFDTSPFLMEFEVAASLWEPRLFPINTMKSLVSLDKIARYSISIALNALPARFPTRHNTLILVFGLPSDLDKGISDLRSKLSTPRKSSIQILSTVERDQDRFTFLLNKDRAERMIAQGYEVALSSLRNYLYMSDCISLKAMKQTGDADICDHSIELPRSRAFNRKSTSHQAGTGEMRSEMPGFDMFAQMMSAMRMGIE